MDTPDPFPCPVNDLDRALIAAQRSPSATPEFYRQLGEGELFLLIPHHPEFEEDDMIKLENGMQMPFVMQRDGNRDVVLIFSSEERAQEGLRRGKVPPYTYRIVSMEASQALEVIGKMNLWTLLNKSCTTPQFILPPDLMRDIASGAVFKAESTADQNADEEVSLKILDPADYPTELVQPVFEVLRKHRQFRAAWIFANPKLQAEAASGRGYQLMILMDPRDDEIFHELNMVIGASKRRDDIVHRGLIDERDSVYTAELFGTAQPFYTATDFGQPPS